MVADLLWAFGILAVAGVAAVVFIVYEQQCERRERQRFERELDELRRQYRA